MTVVNLDDYRQKNTTDDFFTLPFCPKCHKYRLDSLGSIAGHNEAHCPACGDVTGEWVLQLIDRACKK